MAIGDDWVFDYNNKRVANKKALGIDGSTTVYDVNALYSWVMDTFDELAQMDDPIPMLGVVKDQSYTMTNGWFIDDKSVKYLKLGAIATSGYLNAIQVLKLLASGYTSCIAGDIGKQVMDDGSQVGALLAYDNAKRKWWVRSASTIANASVMLIANAVDAAKSYNANTAAFTDETADINNATINDVVLPPIQITTLGDAIYFGDSSKFGRIRLKYDTACVKTGGILQWQYWNGAWVELTGITDPTNFFTAVAGTYNITWTPPTGWVTNPVDGVTKYWMRCVVTTLPTAITTAPLGSQGWQGTGGGTADGASVSGEDLYANVYTLGTIETTPAAQIYIFQAGAAIPEWSDLSNWDRGHIDVLIKVKEAGTELDGAVVTVFARQSGDLYGHYEIDLTAGGRSAVPLSTTDDLNEDIGEYSLLYDAETVGFTTLGQIITGGTSAATAELVAITDWGTTGLLKLRGKKGTFQDNETITGSSEGSATVNGTVGDTSLLYDTETVGFTTMGQTITGGTSGAKRLLRGVQDDGTTGKLVMQVDATQTGNNRDPQYKAFQDDEIITGSTQGSATANGASTTIVSGWSDVTVAFVNGTATHGGTTGTFILGERVTWPTAQSGILLKDTGSAVTLGNCTDTALNTKTITGDISGATCVASQNLQSAHTMNKNFEQQSAYPYDVIINAGDIYAVGRALAEVYQYFKFVCQEESTFAMYTVVTGVITVLDGEEYIIAYSGYVPSVPAPLGTFAGGKYFGAQGIWIEGMATGQSYQYTDSNGVIRQPYASVSVRVTALVSGDRIAVFRTTAGAINKVMYTSHATNNVRGDLTFEVQESLAIDTPSSGVLRAVDASEVKEHRMRYASWTGSILTLPTARTGTQTGAESATVLIDSAASFQTWVILAGDIIRNSTDLSWAQVASVDSQTQLTTIPLAGGSDNLWQAADGYSIHSLPVNYTGSDKAYVPFIDGESTTTYIEKIVLYTADRDVMIRVRKKGIIPFETAGVVGTAGLTVAAIRTTDGIVV